MPNRTTTLDDEAANPATGRTWTLGELVAQLTMEHRDIGRRLQRLAAARPMEPVEVAIRELDVLVSRHTALEIDVFYPVAHALLQRDNLSIVTTAAVEHEPLLALMGMAKQADRGDPLFMPRIGLLQRQVTQHFADEERLIFQPLQDRGFFGYGLEAVTVDEPASDDVLPGVPDVLH
jgi:hypothetical protein